MTYLDTPFALQAVLFYIGMIAGFFGSMLGLGGGWLIVPALQVLGVAPLPAVGTSLTAMIFTSSVGAGRYYMKKILLLSLGLVIGVPAIFGVYAGKVILDYLNALGWSGPLLTTAFMVLLTGLGISMLISSFRKSSQDPLTKRQRWQPIGPALKLLGGIEIGFVNAAILGFFAGILSGLLGIGGGIVLTPALVTLFGIPVVQAASASLVSVLLSSLLGSALYLSDGAARLDFAVSLAIGTTIGSFLGTWTAPKISETFLKRVFGALTLLTALALVIRSIGQPTASVATMLGGGSFLLVFALVSSTRKIAK